MRRHKFLHHDQLKIENLSQLPRKNSFEGSLHYRATTFRLRGFSVTSEVPMATGLVGENVDIGIHFYLYLI